MALRILFVAFLDCTWIADIRFYFSSVIVVCCGAFFLAIFGLVQNIIEFYCEIFDFVAGEVVCFFLPGLTGYFTPNAGVKRGWFNCLATSVELIWGNKLGAIE